MRALIVDDKPENLYLLRALLQAHDYTVEEARHGAEALVRARQTPPQIIISDLLMPVMDGYTLLRRWKADERLKMIPFVIYTATYTEPGDERLALELGADAFILKPAEPAPFMARIRDVLAQAARGELAPPRVPMNEEKVLLRKYNETLIHKLEQKTLQLEQANRELLEDITRREQTAHALQLSEERLRLMTSAGNVGLWDWNLQTNQVVYSSKWKSQLGHEDHEIGDGFSEWENRVHPDDLSPTLERVRACLTQPDGAYDAEFRMRHKSGAWRWIHAHGQVLCDPQGRPVRLLGCHFDVTERKQTEQTHARLAAIVEFSNDAIIGRAPDGTIISWNPAAGRMFGWTAEEVIGKPFGSVLAVPAGAPRGLRFKKILRGETMEILEDIRLRRDGSSFHVQTTMSAVRDEHGNVIFVASIMRDVTDLKQAETALLKSNLRLREITGKLLEVEESERRRINRELHDRIGQNLSALNLTLGITGSQLPADVLPVLGPRFDDARKLVEATSQQVRDIMADLHPPALDDYGLLAALRTHADLYVGRAGFAVMVHGEDLAPRPPPVTEIALFRIAQEALTNTMKHARAGRVDITLAATPHGVNLTVADDGIGFDPEEITESRLHWGMATMRERAEAIGATLRVESTPGKGTRVVVEVPRQQT